MKCTIAEQKLLALDKVLTYINDRTEQMNVDATYGVTLSEGKEFLSNYIAN